MFNILPFFTTCLTPNKQGHVDTCAFRCMNAASLISLAHYSKVTGNSNNFPSLNAIGYYYWSIAEVTKQYLARPFQILF